MDDKIKQHLWLITAKLIGIAALLKNQCSEPLEGTHNHDPWYGLGLILDGIISDLEVLDIDIE